MTRRPQRTQIRGHAGRDQPTLQVVRRYALIQLPGLLLLILLILLVNRLWLSIPSWMGLAIVALAVIKDVILFPLTWRAYAAGDPNDPSVMIGRRGKVISRLDPEGYVQVQGELWRAEADEGDRPVEKGRSVTVAGRDGLKLFVRVN
ncbi:MAG: NfeD family protein [Desulfobacterales bacterium]